jgi:NADH:ubiquinone oxidoreductase subunit E
MDEPKHRITLCMGSSCFSRGNAVNVETIEGFLRRGGIDASVDGRADLVGTLCEGHCKEGPIVVIDGIVHKHVTASTLPDLLASLLPGAEG